jgi:hypothetical protein
MLRVRRRGIWAVCLCVCVGVWVCGQVSVLAVFLHTGAATGSPLWVIQTPYEQGKHFTYTFFFFFLFLSVTQFFTQENTV